MKNIANILTIFRLFLVPLFPIVFFSDHPQGQRIALGIFILAGITDFLDGYIARKYDMITQVGIVLDPLADKLMFLVVLVSLWIYGIVPIFLVAIFVIKETFMIFAGAYLYLRKGKFAIPSNKFGKLATAMLFLAIPLRILLPESSLGIILMVVAFAVMVVAFFTYVQFYKGQRDNL